MHLNRIVAALLLGVTLVACSDSGPKTQAGTPSRPPGPASPTPCPSAPASFQNWPREVPDDLPRPAGARITKIERQSGVTVVQFTTRNSLREGVIHVVREFPKYGWTLGRGDAEVTEADAPFQRGDIRGLVRMLAREQCQTLWLLAIGKDAGFNGAPFAPGYTPPPSSSPLPFG